MEVRRLYTLFILGLSFIISLPLRSQSHEEYMSWDEFLDTYRETSYGEDEGSSAEDLPLIENLITLHENPLNLNTVTREELLQLPFLDESKVDSMLSYRDRALSHNRCVLSLGELLFIRGLTLFDRRMLSLFLTAEPRGATVYGKEKMKNEVDTHFDFPLYERAGPFVGPKIANTLRYRFSLGSRMTAGATFQKDSYEPFGRLKTYPYDYNSLFFKYQSQRWNLLLGDYEVVFGQGLITGLQSWGANRQMLAQALPRSDVVLKCHTSSAEYYFLRGAAGTVRLGRRMLLTAFISWRNLDGRLANGVITSFHTSGLHRTESELEKRRAVGQLMGGARLAYRWGNGQVGLSGVGAWYNKTINPTLQTYNRYYLRGKSAVAMSMDYGVRLRNWNFVGEMALDGHAHFAMTHSMMWKMTSSWQMGMNLRLFSTRYVPPNGRTLSQNSRIQNEQAVLLSLRGTPFNRMTLTAFVEAFRLPRPSYRADTTANGIEAMLQVEYNLKKAWKITGRYKIKSRQYNLTGTKGVMAYTTTQRVALQLGYTQENWNLTFSLGGAHYTVQKSKSSWGGVAAVRARVKPCKMLILQGLVGYFHTDDYDSRVYVYMPQMSIQPLTLPGLADHGITTAWVAEAQPWKFMKIGVRYSLLRYFNRSTISSGATEIRAPAKNDISLALKLSF